MPKVFHSRFFYTMKSCQDLPPDKGDEHTTFIPKTINSRIPDVQRLPPRCVGWQTWYL